MPVFDLGYRKYEGGFRSRLFRWSPIARTSFKTSWNRASAIVLFGSSVLLIIFLLVSYSFGLTKGFLQIPGIPGEFEDGTLYRLVSKEIFFAVLLLAATCGGHIAEDLRTGALQLYFSRPITHLDYVFGKLASVVAMVLIVTLLPAVMLFLCMFGFAPDTGFLERDPFMLVKAAAFSLVIAVVLGALLLAFSALGRQGRNVGVLFAGFYFFSFVLSQVLIGIFRDPRWEIVNLGRCLDAAGRTLFASGATPAAPGGLAWGILASLTFVSLLVLSRRAESVEVVS